MAEATAAKTTYQGQMHLLQKEIMGRYFDRLTRAAEQGDGHERHEQQVGVAAEHVHLREDRDLRDRSQKEQDARLDDVQGFHLLFVATRAATESSEPRFA